NSHGPEGRSPLQVSPCSWPVEINWMRESTEAVVAMAYSFVRWLIRIEELIKKSRKQGGSFRRRGFPGRRGAGLDRGKRAQIHRFDRMVVAVQPGGAVAPARTELLGGDDGAVCFHLTAEVGRVEIALQHDLVYFS